MQALLSSFKIDPSILLFNGILFLVLVQALDKLYWKPVLRRLDQRREEITNAYQAVDDTRREMENLRMEYQGRLSQIEADARSRIQQTVRESQKQREELIARARSDSEEIMRQGAASIEHEKEQMLLAMRDRFDEAAATALAKAIGAPADQGRRRLIDEYVGRNVVSSQS